MNVYAEVVFPLPISRTFSYRLTAALRDKARVGARVAAPFGRRQLTGFIVHVGLTRPAGPAELKDIVDVLDDPPLFTPRFLAFTRLLSRYHYSSWGELLQAALPPSIAARPKALVSLTAVGRQSAAAGVLAGAEKPLAELLMDKAYSRIYLKRRLKAKDISALLARMEKKGLVETHDRAPRTGKTRAKTEEKQVRGGRQLPLDFSFSPGAQAAAGKILDSLRRQAFSLSYLHASAPDREAVYLRLIKTVMAAGGRTLLLVPEITLSAALIGRLEQKMGERAAILHSRQTENQKEAEWRKIQSGKAAVVVGPRSALFAPVRDLRLVIVDEEQDGSFIQSENPAFDARQGALFRAKAEKAAAILGSATPSVGWFHRARSEGFLVTVEGSPSPAKARVVDMTRERGLLSRELEEAIRDRLARREQVLVFLNRKGYSSALVCPRCRYIPKCGRCDIALTYHKREDKLLCRYCGFETPALIRCPRCGEKFLGGREPGIEALEEEVRRKFPAGRVACFDTEVAARRRERAKVLDEAGQGRIDILLGTQLLVHQTGLPPATLVGILNPDALLSLADYRAAQKAYQSLTLMMRSGGENKAEIIIQTALPDHYSIRSAASGDYAAFFKEEITFRRLMDYPPFSRMVEVVFQGTDLRGLARQARGFQDRVRSAAPDVEILGPARATVSKLRGQTRVHLLLRAKKKERLDAALDLVLSQTAWPKAVWVYD